MRTTADFMGQRLAWSFVFESPFVSVGDVQCATLEEFIARIRLDCRLPQEAGDHFSHCLQMAKHAMDDVWLNTGGELVSASEPHDVLRPMRVGRNEVGMFLMTYQGDKGPLFIHW